MAAKNGRKLCDLRVVDLRYELEKRNLDKSGVKQTLTERLQKAMKTEGLDPETYIFGGEETSTKFPNILAQPPRTDIKTDSNHEHDIKTDSNHKHDVRSENNCVHEVLVEETAMDASDTQEVLTKSAIETVIGGTIIIHKIVSSKDLLMDTSNPTEELSKTADENFSEATIVINVDDNETLNTGEVSKSSMESNTSAPEIAEQKDEKITTNRCEVNTAAEIVSENLKKTEDTLKKGKEEGLKTSTTRSDAKLPLLIRKPGEDRNLWVSNLAQNTSASDLNKVFGAHGKVSGAKVVVNSKYPGSCRFGYVTMETVQDADNCIAKLINTELNGQIIAVEKFCPDHMKISKMANNNPKPTEDKKETSTVKQTEKSDKEKSSTKEAEKRSGTDTKKSITNETPAKKHKSDRKPIEFPKRSTSVEEKSNKDYKPRGRDNSLLTFEKIKGERNRQRLREKERQVREENRRRLKETVRQREVDRLQRLEAERLDRERHKLRLERERLERDKADLMHLEKERHKLEREKLELEKLELEKVRLRLEQEENRRAAQRTVHRRESPFDDRKRPRHYEEMAPYPPRQSNPTYVDRGDRGYVPSHYRRDERDRKPVPEPKSGYFSNNKDPHRFDLSNNSANSWSRTAPPPRVYEHPPQATPRKSWDSSVNKWPQSNTGYSNISGTPGVPPQSPMYNYKPLSSIRKF